MPASEAQPPAPQPLDARIFTVRGQQVMLDSDLAAVYGVLTKNLNKAVARNPDRFPSAFSFQLAQDEWDGLRFQFGTLDAGRGRHKKYLPHVFTEHGAVMLASVLNSAVAVQASIAVVDAFVRLRRVLVSNRSLARKIAELGEKVDTHDRAIAVIFHELRALVEGGSDIPERPKGRIGYKTAEERERERKKEG